MGWFKKLLGREGEKDHQKWLATHPGKDSTGGEAPSVSAEEEQRTRAQMEGEMEQSRSKRLQE
jgi:hypothetical protein